MIKYKNLFWLLLYVAPFVNFSFLPGSKLPLAYLALILIVLLLIVVTRRIPKNLLGSEDIFFVLFAIISLVAVQINSSDYSITRGIIQLLNIVLTYLLYKVSLLLLQKSEADGEKVLRKVFNYNSVIQLFALVFFIAGFVSHSFLENVVNFFNNSGNFTIGALSTVLPRARLLGFSPEPSFWSFFVAFNLAIGLTLEKPNKSYIILNIVNLLLTVSRTGFLIGVCIVLLKFIKGSIFYKFLAVAIFTTIFVFFYDYLDLYSLLRVDPSFKQRIGSLIVAFDIANNNPFFGIGLGNFHTYAKSHQLEFFDIFNFFLNILVASGLFGLLSLTGLFASIHSRIHSNERLPFYASIIGWMTVSSYNLPYVWIVYGLFVYISIQKGAGMKTDA